MWVDTHCHLPMLKHGTREEILNRAELSGVRYLVTIGTEPEDWESSQQAAQNQPNVFFSLGLHPHGAERWNDVRATLESFFVGNKPPAKCVAIGETGLDYYYENSAKDAQKVCFTDQLALARRVNLPLVIHCRDAYEDLFEIIKRDGMPKAGGIMHCFTGTAEVAKQAVDHGLMISFSGILTFKNAQAIRDAAKIVPDDRILLETDCPFLAPIPNRGKPNEPSFLPHTAKVLALVRQQPESQIAEKTTANARRVFGF